ncbi:MAG: hypothetical protein IJO74_04725 [Clostridia bacterium]|nr:hypothetical protein [Clostridia bacterium]
MSKIQKIILLVLAVVVAVLTTVFAVVFTKVNSVKYNITAVLDGQYRYSNGVLINGSTVKRFNQSMGTFSDLEVGVFDISDYEGAENLETKTVTAYIDSDNLIPVTKDAMPYYNLDSCFIYGGEGEEKYIADTDKRIVYPLMEKSSANVKGVSISGEFLLEINGKDIIIHQRKDRTTNQIISEKKVNVTQSYASCEFVNWYNQRFALVKLSSGLSTSYIVIDGQTAEYIVVATTNDAPLLTYSPEEDGDSGLPEGMVNCYFELISDRYLQFYEIENESVNNTNQVKYSGNYMDIFSSAVYNVRIDSEIFDGENKLLSVSRDAGYALYKTRFADNSNHDIQYAVFNSKNGKHYTVNEMLGDFAFIDDAYFIYDNILLVNYADIRTGNEKSCAIKLNF